MDQTPPRLPQPADPPYHPGMEARVAVLEQIARETKDVLLRMDKRMDSFEGRMDRFESRLDRLGDRLDRLGERQASDFKWLLLLGLGGISFLFGTMGHGFHWF